MSFRLVVAFVLLVAACADRALPAPDPVAVATFATASGVVIDVDLLFGLLAGFPNSTAAELVQGSCIPRASVSAIYEDGSLSKDVTADDACGFSLPVKTNSAFHFVAALSTVSAQGTSGARTVNQALTRVSTSDLSSVLVYAVSPDPNSTAVGMAAALGIELTSLTQAGACVVPVDDHRDVPFFRLRPSAMATDDPDAVLLALTDPTKAPPTYVLGNTSPVGIFGIVRRGNVETRDLHLLTLDAVADGGLSYAPATCTLRPSYLTFLQLEPL